MLNLGRMWSSDCQRISRRALLEAGACSALGIGLPHLLARQASASPLKAKTKSVLLLWLWGGPSHHETWDPKPNAPLKIRGPYNPIATATPGTQICELLPMTSQRSNKLAIIRSMAHDQKDHNVAGTVALTGNTSGAKASGAIPFPGRVRPSMGSLVSFLTQDRTGNWPSFTAIGRNCNVSGATLRGQTANALGAPHDPFRLAGFSFENGVTLPRSLEPLGDIGSAGLDHRRQLLAGLDNWQRKVESSKAIDRYGDLRQKAFGLLTSSGAKRALNLDVESESLRDRYGRTVFGQNCILGRRLIESGVPFVQINWSGNAEDEQQGGDGGWDLHYRLFERMQDRYCPVFDRAFSTLLDDMESRGLLESTLVLAMGEFGRSPAISGIGGREHWPWGYSLALAGGGTPGGTVVGSTTFDGGYPASRPNHPVDLIMTVLELMGLDRDPLFAKEAGLLGTPIRELT